MLFFLIAWKLCNQMTDTADFSLVRYCILLYSFWKQFDNFRFAFTFFRCDHNNIYSRDN